MRHLIFSDIHLHNWTNYGTDKTYRVSNRLLIQKDILQQIINIAKKEKAILLFGGDFVHSVGSVPVEVLNILSWFFKEIEKEKLELYCTVGNHDLALRSNNNEWHNILNLFQNREERNNKLSLLKPSIRLVDFDEQDIDHIKNFDIVILHKQPATTNSYGYQMEGVNWKKLVKNNRLVFFGHDHCTKKLGATAYVIGAPMQLTQADVGEKRGCWLVDSDNWSINFIKLDYPEIEPIIKEEIIAKEIITFDQKIKSIDFKNILIEWLNVNNKPIEYLTLIEQELTSKLQLAKKIINSKLEKVHLTNFLSIEDSTVEFKNGFWLIVGKNGTGKSTICEGVSWILWDTTSKGLAKNEVIRNRPELQKDAIGEIKIGEYLIVRSAKKGLSIFKDKQNLGEGMTKLQAQEYLEKEILGFDKTVYFASCYFSQEQLLLISKLGDAEKTNMITNLLGFETYDSLYVDMDLKVKECDVQKNIYDQKIIDLNNQIWKNEEQQKSVKEQIEMFTKQECSLKDEQSKVTIQIEELSKMLGNIVVPSVTTEEIDVSLLALNSSKTEMSTKYKTFQENGHLQTKDLRNQLAISQNDLNTILVKQNIIDKEKIKYNNEVEFTKKLIQKHIDNIDKLQKREFGQRCTHCGALVTKENVQTFIDEEQIEITNLNNKIIPISNFDWDKQLESLYDQEATLSILITSINQQITEHEANIKDSLEKCFAEITAIDCKIQELQIQKGFIIKKVTETNSHKENLTQQIKHLQERSTNIQKQLQELNINDKLKKLNDLEIELLAIKFCLTTEQENLKKLTTHQEIYDFWKNSFSNKGIRPLLLSNFCNEINPILTKYCYKINNGQFKIMFSPTSSTKSGEERNKLGMTIIYKNQEVIYESLSGGEKTRINLPICFALNAWITQKYNLSGSILKFMVMDELFSAVDKDGEERIANFLNEEGQDKFIGVISHGDEIKSYCNNIMTVIKDNEVTHIC